jgi:2-polyprenyl-3-methyl-5-hydroxy-6-metoxy-1,4-benzoquinol methylase
MRILVAIANYGLKNRVYLERLLAEYRSMSYRVDIVVFSNVPKDLGPDVEVRVGLPDKDPWSLPFGHKQLFADRLNDYDLFIYSEDDVLIRQRNLEAFLAVTPSLPEDQIAGFLRYEEDACGRWHCPDVHASGHWVPSSIRRYGPYTFAYFTNEHAACYVFTRAQLQRAIASGGFLVPPHQGPYDLLCTAATDPYTQCGSTKVICLTHIDDFMVHHLPNKYIGIMGLAFDRVQDQVNVLFRCLDGQQTCAELLPAPGRPKARGWGKSYYEPVRREVLAVVPKEAKRILSIGCGAGATEAALVQRGAQVIGIPLDAVIAATARANGVELTPPSFLQAFELLRGQSFDCLLLMDILPYVQDPPALLATSGQLLARKGTVVATTPNFDFRGHRRNGPADNDVGCDKAVSSAFHAHRTTPRIVAGWMRRSGLRVRCIRYDEKSRFNWLVKISLGFAGPYLSRNLTITAGKQS